MGDSVGDAKVNEVVVLSPIELLCRTVLIVFAVL